jgi:nucleoside-diphosphate-sugar epimerase
MRVLAIGATGFIGRHVVSRLVELGHNVAVLHRGKTLANLPDGVLRILGNRDRLDDSRADLESFAPDVVLDAIPYTERQARGMVEACRGKTARVVALSSADVYRNYDGFRGRATASPDPVPLAEDAPCRRTRYPYRGSDVAFEYAHDYEKILVEEVLLNEPDLPAVVLRLPAVYGPGDRQHRLRPYLQRMVDDRPGILLHQEQAVWRWTRGFVVNVAAAVALAVTDASSTRRVYNVGEEPALTEREWVERIGAAAGWKGEVVAVPRERMGDHLKQLFDWRYELWTDTARIREELGYAEPVPLGEALERTVEWERSTLDDAEVTDYGEEDALLQGS